MDLPDWMGNLPGSLYDIPINWLAIPGSHDSFSYSLTPNSDIAPDDWQKCWTCIPCSKRLVRRWAVTQTTTCQEQLNQGIRYFDIRLAPKPGSFEPYVVHGLYGSSITKILGEIHAFLEEHKAEIVLLDFQHFYNFTPEVHAWLINILEATFGRMLCQFEPGMPDVRLSRLWSSGQRVLVFYRDDYARFSTWVFPGSWIPNPWPNTVKASKMIQILENNFVKGRYVKSFFVNQGVLTPNTRYITFHIYGTLQSSLVPEATQKLLEWVRGKSAGQNGINVVIADDVGSRQFNFAYEVIRLNYTLAENTNPANQ